MSKKSKILLIIILSIISVSCFSHPLHLTITNIDFKNDSVFISVSMNGHAIEHAINDANNIDFVYESLTEDSIAQALLFSYLNDHLKVKAENEIKFKFLSLELNDGNVRVNMHAKYKPYVSVLFLENTLLSGLHGDQKNMVILSSNGVEKGVEFNAVETKKTITLVE